MSLGLFSFIVVLGLIGSFCTFAVLVSGLFFDERIAHLEDLRRQQELETLLRTAQMQRLQAQIEPHFLFNTLNILARLAYMNRGREAAEGIHALSRLSRASLQTPDKLIPLREELDLTRSYLSLQQLRFGGRLTVGIEIAPELLDVLIPPLTIQPVVENACKYAVDRRSTGGEILIGAHVEGAHLHLWIRDNGPDEQADSHSPVEPGLGLGIENVRQRLFYWFGSPCGLAVNPLTTGGTEVVLTIPTAFEEVMVR